jgi:hypothetical protein
MNVNAVKSGGLGNQHGSHQWLTEFEISETRGSITGLLAATKKAVAAIYVVAQERITICDYAE